MTVDGPESGEILNLRESREGVRSLRFFVSAINQQLSDLDDKLGELEALGTINEYYDTLARLEAERDAAREEAFRLYQRAEELERELKTVRESLEGELAATRQDSEREIAQLRDEVERQRVSFSDHHAARQEIAQLRQQLEALQAAPPTEQEPREESRKKRFGRM